MVDHDKLVNLDYDSAGHMGFASQDVLTMVSGVLNDLILESNDFGSIITVSGTYKGDTLTVVVDDDSTVFGNVLYQATDFHYERADADVYTTMPCRAIVIEPGVGSQKVLVRGQICNTGWNWSPGTIWVSLITGELTQTKPLGNEDQAQEVGWALSTDTIFFDSTSIVMTILAGDRGVFAGGYNSAIVELNIIQYITISTTGNATNFGDLTDDRVLVGACSNGGNNRGCIAGGHNGSTYVDTIDYITINLTGNATGFGDLTEVRGGAAAGTSNNTNERGVFGGGSNTIDYITISTTGNATDFGDLLTNTEVEGAFSNGTNNRGVWGGAGGVSNVIQYVTITTTGNASDFGDLTVARYYNPGASNLTNERGTFGGGYTVSNVNTIDYITISTTGNATDFGDLTEARRGGAGNSNGTNERGTFGGGYTVSNVNTIDYITISTTGNATDFGDLTEAILYLGGTSNG